MRRMCAEGSSVARRRSPVVTAAVHLFVGIQRAQSVDVCVCVCVCV